MTAPRATCVLALLALWAAPGGAGRPRIMMEGASDDQFLPPNEELDIPKYVKTFSDDNFHQDILKKHDVVLMYAREQHCPDCDYWAKHLYNATRELGALEDVAIGQIDANEEMDLLKEHGGHEEDLPVLMVFKTHETLEYKRQPIQFMLNQRIKDDLTPFVQRLRGPATRKIASKDDMEAFFEAGKEFSDKVVFAMWKPPAASATARKVADGLYGRVAEIERYNSLYAEIDGDVFPELAEEYNAVYKLALQKEAAGDAATSKKRKPSESVYVVSYDLSYTPPKQAWWRVPSKGDFKKSTRNLLTWVAVEKTKREGHKYDLVDGFVADDVYVPSNCTDEARLSNETQKYVKLDVRMRTATVGTVFLAKEIEMLTLANATMQGIDDGIIGMCQGGNRTLVVPHHMREGWRFQAAALENLGAEIRLLVDVHLKHVGETHEMPGRIEWESDPEKIAEYHRKAEEQDKERQEKIDRGEDPDAQCAADDTDPTPDAGADDATDAKKTKKKKKKTSGKKGN